MSPPELKSIVVGCAANARYALPLAVMLRSMLANLESSRTLDIFVVDDGLDPKDRERVVSSLTNRAMVHWLRPQRSGFSGLPLWGRMPITTYDKVVIARLLPSHISKVIWLDCDLLVLGDVTQLWDGDVETCHALAVQDAIVPNVSSRFGVAGYEDLNIAGDTKYFNAGVMVINLALWRRDDIAERALDYLKRYRDRVFFWDQEGLNAVLAGKWRELEPHWNWNVSIDRTPLARSVRSVEPLNGGRLKDPQILHFSGNLKPWTYRGRDARHALYFRYLDMTSWTGWRPIRDWRSTALGMYESSLLRRTFYPAERWGMQLQRAITRRYVTEEEEE